MVSGPTSIAQLDAVLALLGGVRLGEHLGEEERPRSRASRPSSGGGSASASRRRSHAAASKSYAIRCGSGSVSRRPGLIAQTPSTRSGASAAISRACPAPVQTPASTACSAPTASSTAHSWSIRTRSSICVDGDRRAAAAVAGRVAHHDAVRAGEERDLGLPRPRLCTIESGMSRKTVGSPSPYTSKWTRTPPRWTCPCRTGASARIRPAPPAGPRPARRHRSRRAGSAPPGARSWRSSPPAGPDPRRPRR